MRDDTCKINRCGREHGIGTHMSLTGQGRGADQTIRVCEEHWQALRPILPVETPTTEPEPKQQREQITLGEYLALMEQMDAQSTVVFDFGGLVGTICSWRGAYSQPSVDTSLSRALTVAEVCADLAGVLAGRELQGWKGGDYAMGEDQPLWADESGTCPGRAVVGVRQSGKAIVTVETEEHGW